MSSAETSQIIDSTRISLLLEESLSTSVQAATPLSWLSAPFLVLVLFQLLDLQLTLHGISAFGSSIEGNPLISMLFPLLGTTASLVVVKMIAITLVLGLSALSGRVRWLPAAIWSLNCVYGIAAIIPWSLLLFA
jgi:hypothetical protein